MRRKAALYPALLSLVASLVLLAGCTLGGNEPDGKNRNVAQETPEPSAQIPGDEPVARVASQVGPSVVQVNVRGVQETPFGTQEAEGVGSGVIYRRDGYVITNAHVVEGAEEVNIAFADGSTERGRVVGADPYTDLAVVRVQRGDLPAAKFDEEDIVVGQLAVAVGSPSGFQSTVTAGVISGLNREIPAELTGGQQAPSLVDLIQTDAGISPGNSGGALVDRDGEVVGINVAYLPPETGVESIGFAIPAATAVDTADEIIATGSASAPFLGVGYADITADIADQFGLSVDSGALVTSVTPGTPADDAGLRTEDVIVGFEGEAIASSGDLLAALRDQEPGDTVSLTFVRGGSGSEREVEVTLAERQQ